MAFAKWPEKDPDDELDYSLSWADQMTIDTDTIASYEPIVAEGDIEIVMDLGKTPSHDDTLTLVWLRGGTAGTTCQIVNRITTTEGRQYDHTRTIKIKER
jgi:hypothetical protein